MGFSATILSFDQVYILGNGLWSYPDDNLLLPDGRVQYYE